MINKKTVAATAAGLALVVASAIAQSPAANMSFFVTSSNSKGGNLGGLAGADQVCQSLALAPALWTASSMTSWVRAQISVTSCSTHPGFG